MTLNSLQQRDRLRTSSGLTSWMMQDRSSFGSLSSEDILTVVPRGCEEQYLGVMEVTITYGGVVFGDNTARNIRHNNVTSHFLTSHSIFTCKVISNFRTELSISVDCPSGDNVFKHLYRFIALPKKIWHKKALILLTYKISRELYYMSDEFSVSLSSLGNGTRHAIFRSAVTLNFMHSPTF